jgi:hypothetical protein
MRSGRMAQHVTASIDPAAVHRELSEAIERTEALGRIIGATLDDAEREFEAIKRAGSAKPVSRSSP